MKLLTTLAKVKSYLKINNTDDDEFINMLIDSAESTIENYCNRKFSIQSYTGEQHTIMHKVFPQNYPIKSVERIVRAGPAVFNLSYVTGDGYTNFRLHPTYIEFMDWKYVTMTNKIQWGTHEESYIEISYTAGMSDNEIPGDLSLVATKLVALEYKESRENKLGVEIEKEGDVQFTYMKKDIAMPANIATVLQKYCKIRTT